MPCQCKTDKQKAKCQWWIGPEMGILEKNGSGEQRVATGCFPEVLIRWMGFVCKTNASAAAAVEDHRNHLVIGLQQLLPALGRIAEDAKQIEHQPPVD